MPNPAAIDSPDSELLSTSGAARVLGISEGTVRLWANMGKLATRRTAGTGIRLYERRAIEELAASRAEEMSSEGMT